MANVQVILKEQIKGLGAEADVVQVKRGYARNFLVPQGKAYDATAGNLRHLNHLKAIRATREAAEVQEAEKIAAKLKKLKLKMTLQTGQGGKAFGSITTSCEDNIFKLLLKNSISTISFNSSWNTYKISNFPIFSNFAENHFTFELLLRT
jgi:ribosomal protein L9